MLVMNSRKMIFVHLQKCGGTSVEVSFYEHCRWNDLLIGSSSLGELMQWEYFAKFALHKHSAAKEIERVIGSDNWVGYYSWATVRNPFSRVASLYGYVSCIVATGAPEVGYPLDGSPAEQSAWARRDKYPHNEPWSFPAVKAFLLSRDDPQPFSAFLRNENLYEDAAFSPQWWGIQNENGNDFAVSCFVKLEELPAQWPGICRELHLPGIPLIYANATDRKFLTKPSKLFEHPDDVELMRTRFSADFLNLGYDPDVIP